MFSAFSAYLRALSLKFEKTAVIKIPRPSLSRAKVSINSKSFASEATFFSTASARRLDCCSANVDLQNARGQNLVRRTRQMAATQTVWDHLTRQAVAQRGGDGFLPPGAVLITELLDTFPSLVQALVETSVALFQLPFALGFQALLNTETVT